MLARKIAILGSAFTGALLWSAGAEAWAGAALTLTEALIQQVKPPPPKKNPPEVEKLLARIQALNKERRDAIRKEYEDSKKKLEESGRKFTVDLDVSRALLEAELFAAETPAERLKAYQAYRDDVVSYEKYCKGLPEDQRLSPFDLLKIKAARLEAEVLLLDAENQGAKGPAAINTAQRVRDLLTERRAAVSDMQKHLQKRMEEGKVTLVDVIDQCSRMLLDAELALAEKPADRRTAFHVYYTQMNKAEEIVEARFKAERSTIVEYAQKKAARLEAEVWLERAKKPGEEDSPQIRKLLKDRLEALREEEKALKVICEAGKITLCEVLDISPQLREAQLAVANTPAAQLAAHEAYRDDMIKLEEVYKERYQAKLNSLSDYLWAKAARLDAELSVLRAKSEVSPPKH